MSGYAAGTSVPVDRSKSEIERVLAKYGADQFVYAIGTPGAMVMFRAHGRCIRFIVPIPTRDDIQPPKKVRWGTTDDSVIQKRLDQEGRRRWRALLLCIKAKLEAVASGIATFENEFLPYTLISTPGGKRTVAEALGPTIEKALTADAIPNVAGLLSGPVPA